MTWNFRIRKKTNKVTYGRFLIFAQCTRKPLYDDLLERLNNQQCPRELCGVSVPENLNAVSYGTLDTLQRAASSEDVAVSIITLLLNVNANDVYKEDVNKVFGFIKFVERELERINKLFSSIKTSFSPEEINAGVKQLKFGTFGVLDWYAKRMGIADQNEVMDVGWVRIYQCMKNDNDKSEYERRLAEIYKNKSKK